MYRDAVAWFAGEHLLTGGDGGYVNDQYRYLQQFFNWFAFGG